MLRKALCLAVVIVFVFSLLTGCGGTQNIDNQTKTQAQTAKEATTQVTTAAEAKPVTIKIFQNQPEYTDAFNAYVNEYKKAAPNVTIEMEIMQADYPTILKSKIASGDIPDVFCTTAGGELKAYAEYTADLTNEPLAVAMTDSVRQNMTYDGKVLGFPYKVDYFGILYNKKMFADAGITQLPMTLAELEDACKKLQAKGITPFANGFKEWWVQKHIFQHFLGAESNGNAESLVNDFISGKTTFKDHPLLITFFDFIDFLVKYGTDKPLETDYNGEVSALGTGKVAMITGQGSWAEEGITKLDPNIELGIMPYPISADSKNTNFCAGAGQCVRLYKDSKVLDETRKLYNWLYTSDYGKNWFSQVAKVNPPLKDVPLPDLQIPKDFVEKTKTIPVAGEPVDYSLDSFHQKFGEIMQSYIAKGITRDQAIDEIQKAWIKLGAAN